MSPPGKTAAAKSRKTGSKASARRRKEGRYPLPDLSDIAFAFSDAHALVTVAHIALLERKDYGPEENVLRHGVEALDRLQDRLDEADMQLGRFRRHVLGVKP